jgi:cell wall-associated NlpC family hydrolase
LERLLRRRRHLSLIGVIALAVAGILTLGSGIAATEPAPIASKRAEVNRLQAQLDAMDGEVEQAAEAYNGARYQLGQVTERIAENARQTRQTSRDLAASREVLADRLRQLYARPEPSLVEVLVSSGSVTAAADQLDLLDRIGQQDARVVGSLRDQKARLAALGRQLESDRRTAEAAVAARQRERQRVQSLLARRQALVDGASRELRTLLRVEQERKRREAAAQAALARQQAAAAVAATTPAPSAGPSAGGGTVGTPPAAAAPSAPSAPAADGGANAAAARYALQFLGVPYVWGGASPSGFDCSGLATYVFAKYGKSVPHYTGAIWSAFPQVSREQLQVGDLVFFHGLGHMGIYLGNDQFVHAPHTGDVVKVSQLSTYSGYVGAVRP